MSKESNQVEHKEAIISLSYQVEALIRVLENKQLLSREEVMNEIMEIRKEMMLRNKENGAIKPHT